MMKCYLYCLSEYLNQNTYNMGRIIEAQSPDPPIQTQYSTYSR